MFELKQKDPIDVVVAWVDDEDPLWRADFDRHSGKATRFSDRGVNRYRDWGLLRYWFRGLEKYAPWVRRVHFVTCGHYPSWLNLDHPKLQLVRHTDYIPLKDLPTFNARPIEINFHRIKGLAEKFVYFNDDMFLINEAPRKIFFKGNLPRDSAILTAYNGLGVSKVRLNSTAIINQHFSKWKCIRKYPFRWFNIRYSAELLRTLLLLPWENFTGFQDNHLPNCYLKSTFLEVWKKEFNLLSETSSSKFRDNDRDVSQHLFKFWQIAAGKFVPINRNQVGEYYALGRDCTDLISKRIQHSRRPIICLNDIDAGTEGFSIKRDKIIKAFDTKLSCKSEFELGS